mmetsp:Transcript_9954/g.18115  ORF Transcript_9954/g.18115 Transcript_9954/m.18115 type:complete len:139 (-) Transcript_9954:983-1399(-)
MVHRCLRSRNAPAAIATRRYQWFLQLWTMHTILKGVSIVKQYQLRHLRCNHHEPPPSPQCHLCQAHRQALARRSFVDVRIFFLTGIQATSVLLMACFVLALATMVTWVSGAMTRKSGQPNHVAKRPQSPSPCSTVTQT